MSVNRAPVENWEKGQAVMGTSRSCDARCHNATGPVCRCWCGGLFHGSAGEDAREAFVEAFGEDVPLHDPHEEDGGQEDLFRPGLERFDRAMRAAIRARDTNPRPVTIAAQWGDENRQLELAPVDGKIPRFVVVNPWSLEVHGYEEAGGYPELPGVRYQRWNDDGPHVYSGLDIPEPFTEESLNRAAADAGLPMRGSLG